MYEEVGMECDANIWLSKTGTPNTARAGLAQDTENGASLFMWSQLFLLH